MPLGVVARAVRFGAGRHARVVLLLLFVIDFVELALLVLALLQQVAVAVDVDVEIAVEFDDALVRPRLLLDG